MEIHELLKEVKFSVKHDSIYFQLILKELDNIQDIIKNLDSLIQNSKNFAMVFWGGGLYLIVQHLQVDKNPKGYLIILTAIIPILFWIMDFQWRKHILQCSIRMKNISKFINSPDFIKIFNEDEYDIQELKFPLYDPLSWFFLKSKDGILKIHETKIEDPQHNIFDLGYFRNESEPTFKRTFFYKEAAIFFLTMIIISLILGIIFLNYSSENPNNQK